jgi:hypothetical protein
MNVNDIMIELKAELESYKDNYNKKLFDKQWELIEKYKYIEGLEGFFTESALASNVQTKGGQIVLKDFLWRTAEEVAEGIEAFKKEDMIHFKEELIDALHFLIEFNILADIRPEELMDVSVINEGKKEVSVFESSFDVFYYLGLIGNTLKNKKWKVTEVETDVNRFKELSLITWSTLLGLFSIVFDSPEEVMLFYLKKNEVNKFRQKTNY